MAPQAQQTISDLPTTHKLEAIYHRLGKIDAVLLGEHGRLGVVGKVDVLWRTYVFLLCGISALAGSLITFLIMRH